MTKPMVRIHNVQTDEIIDREMTDEEFAEYEADQLAKTKAAEAEAEKEAARSLVLEKLGLTSEELAALLG